MEADRSEVNQITEKIIGAAIEVHRNIGPGLFEKIYEECLCIELQALSINFERQKQIPIVYKGTTFEFGFRTDLVVEETIVVELKSVSTLLPIHESQILNYLKISKLQIGLLINFNVPLLVKGIRRVAL